MAAQIMAAKRLPRLPGAAGVEAMLVKGISRGDLEAAVEIASGTLGNRLELYAMYPANRRRSAWRFRVNVADPDAPGARRSTHTPRTYAPAPRHAREHQGRDHQHPQQSKDATQREQEAQERKHSRHISR